ncbi:MAG: hypothetical protein P1U65_07455 [Minwuia sp.]|nr:hypothetical protein [Minwuia sp.]
MTSHAISGKRLPYSVEGLARRFIDGIRAALTPDELAELIRRTSGSAKTAGRCASLDYIDAAAVMAAAFADMAGHEPAGRPDQPAWSVAGDLSMIADAWVVARLWAWTDGKEIEQAARVPARASA